MKKSIELAAPKPDVRVMALLKVMGITFFSFATASGALIRIPLPFTPVPVTLQTMFVLMSGLMLGRLCGAASQALYLTFGLLGLPFFAGATSGTAVIFGPTAGYLLGFIVASFIAGTASQSNTSTLKSILYLAGATLLIYVMGTTILCLATGASFTSGTVMGILPFIPGDVVKLLAAFGIWHWGKKAVDNVFQ